MRLLEYEGKRLLARHGIPIPPGALWPEVPPGSPWMVKAQSYSGGRAKRGGIRRADTLDVLARHASDLLALHLDGEPIRAVYVEQRLAAVREVYLAAFVNRDLARVSLLASASGGVDIESAPRSQIVQVDLDPLTGLSDFHLRRLVAHLDLDSVGRRSFSDLAARTATALVTEDAELIEINPAIQTTTGDFVAADAKVILDDDAVSRHPDRPAPRAWQDNSEFMRRCRYLEVIGVDNRPNMRLGYPTVAVLSNGAGLTMATYDQIALAGIDVAGAVELHGALSRGAAHMRDVFGALFMLGADIVFINAFYQLRSCELLAQALIDALADGSAPSPDNIVARLRGVGETSSQRVAANAGCFVTSSLCEATDQVLRLARAPSSRRRMGAR